MGLGLGAIETKMKMTGNRFPSGGDLKRQLGPLGEVQWSALGVEASDRLNKEHEGGVGGEEQTGDSGNDHGRIGGKGGGGGVVALAQTGSTTARRQRGRAVDYLFKGHHGSCRIRHIDRNILCEGIEFTVDAAGWFFRLPLLLASRPRISSTGNSGIVPPKRCSCSWGGEY